MRLRRIKDLLASRLMLMATVFAALLLVLIAIGLLQKSWPILESHSLSGLLFSSAWHPLRGEFGLATFIIGTLWVTAVAMIIAVPLSLLTAIYLAEYAPDNRLTQIIRVAMINLAGIPSVVYGLFGLGLFVMFLNFGSSILAASLTLSIMTLPVIVSTAEEALRAVPTEFRVVSISLGTTKWETIRRVVLPQGIPGIITGVILGLERAAGETAPILFTGAAFFLPRLPNSPFDETMALPYHLFVITTQVPGMSIQIQYGTVLVLLAFVLGMNIIATVIRSRARARRQW